MHCLILYTFIAGVLLVEKLTCSLNEMSSKGHHQTRLTMQKVRQLSARHNKQSVCIYTNEALEPKALASCAVKTCEQQCAHLQGINCLDFADFGCSLFI
jgi:hypothetical protein